MRLISSLVLVCAAFFFISTCHPSNFGPSGPVWKYQQVARQVTPFVKARVSATIFQRLNVVDLYSCYHNRVIRWTGHVARMPMTRAPRRLLIGRVVHSRPNGCPEMTWGRPLKKAPKCKGLPVNFKEWRTIAEDRTEWRSWTYSKPMPSSENWSYRDHESKDEHCITQKDTQYTICCCFFAIGEYILI